ncbi:Cytochrome protein, partial [Ophiophagus hannah]
MLHGFQTVKEGLTTHPEDVSGRPLFPFFKTLGNNKGVTLSSGQNWKWQRRFSMATLKTLGMGKSILEYQIQEEAQNLVEVFRKTEGTTTAASAFIFWLETSIFLFILIFQNTKNQPKSPYDEKNMVQSIFDLFLGGTETGGTTLYWGFQSVMRIARNFHTQMLWCTKSSALATLFRLECPDTA